MNKKTIITITILIAIISFLAIKVFGNNEKEENNAVMSSSASSNTQDSATKSNPTEIPSIAVIPADKIEVVHFHGTHQCFSCITVGKYALQTIKDMFLEEYQSEKIVFRDINIELPENKEIVIKYQARGSSLFVNAISGDKDNIEEDITVWRLVNNQEKFIDYFENKLNTLLGK